MDNSSQLKAISLDLFRSSLEDLDKSNRWVILGDTLPWEELEKLYNSKMNNEKRGAGNKPARMMIGACIIKHKSNLSDVETIEAIRENPYMQYLCGLTEMTDQKICDPSLLVYVRKRLDIEDINAMSLKVYQQQQQLKEEARKRKEEEAKKNNEEPPKAPVVSEDAAEFVDESGHKHAGVMKVDATCCDAEVRYPVDVDILHDGCKVVDRYIKKICKLLELPDIKTNYKDARSFYIELIKQKKKRGKLVRLTISMLLTYLRKDLWTLNDLFIQYKGSRELLAQHERHILGVIHDMWNQQKMMYEAGTHRCDNRIVSIFQGHVRPIQRGKAKAKTEFGAKIGASVCDHYTFIDHHSWDAYNEASDLLIHIEKYQERFGCLPATVEADKIYMNKANRQLLAELGIKTYCKPLGRPSKTAKSEEEIAKILKAVGDRNEVEATFGTGKRVYRANNIRAKLPNTAECWTGLCYFVKNVMKFLAELCHVLTKIWQELLVYMVFVAYEPNMATYGRRELKIIQ